MINIHFISEGVGILLEVERKSIHFPTFLGYPDADHHLLFGQWSSGQNRTGLGGARGLNFKADFWFLVAVLELMFFLVKG